ncbi:MAG: DUF1570 domain-containing protein [Phycisphaerales bacterium]|nr:MAG: DUF1570 domain-containing protein [Phycisphaerales bacterium]
MIRPRTVDSIVRLFIVCAACAPSAFAQPQLRVHNSTYYTVHTDLDADVVREATVRLTRMAEEYARRTRGFSRKISVKLPFYLFKEHEDYIAAGGLEGSNGVFYDDKLMAVIGHSASAFAWGTVQHEGFHQFVRMVIGGEIPVWVNEGMAEYFGEGLFTGDDFIAGLIPQWRLAQVQRKMKDARFPPLRGMMQVTREEWNRRMSGNDYDQAWSMVQFLAHGDDGKYDKPFNAFLREAGRTGVWDRAWVKHFGPGTEEFEKAWREYWLNLPYDPTADLYAKATVSTLTSFLARAVSQGQAFESFERFVAAAKAGELQVHEQDWLPPSLLRSALAGVRQAGEWSLEQQRRKNPKLICARKDDTRLVGTFTLRKTRVKDVFVEVQR